ncbi:aldose 1-epimerase, partial [Pseudomonas carnis]|nr:aldose 1-epimerase [Pseudomonas carnis]
MIELSDQLTHLVLAPALGGSLVNWTVRATGQPLLRHSDEHAINTGLPGKLGCYPLAPWSNRIAHGGFDNPGGWLAMAPNSLTAPFPIHGSAWQQAGEVTSQSEHEVALELRCETPFAYHARQRFRLNNG